MRGIVLTAKWMCKQFVLERKREAGKEAGREGRKGVTQRRGVRRDKKLDR